MIDMYTYIVTTEDKRYLKIGKSIDVNKRLSGLQTGSPEELILEGWFEGDIEDSLHKEYRDYNKKNEWFLYEILPELVKKEGYIEATKKTTYKVWTEENTTNVVLMYKDKLGATEYHTATIYKKVAIGDVVTMRELGYTQKRFCDEILDGHIPSPKWDHSTVEIVDILPRSYETDINGWGYCEEISYDTEYYESPYMRPHEGIVTQRKRLLKEK